LSLPGTCGDRMSPTSEPLMITLGVVVLVVPEEFAQEIAKVPFAEDHIFRQAGAARVMWLGSSHPADRGGTQLAKSGRGVPL
jgi:hypothetical protein